MIRLKFNKNSFFKGASIFTMFITTIMLYAAHIYFLKLGLRDIGYFYFAGFLLQAIIVLIYSDKLLKGDKK